MFRLLLTKFICNPKLIDKLVATGDAILQEGNTWGDTFWGIDLRTGKGENWLGRLLMLAREVFISNTNQLEELAAIPETDLPAIQIKVRHLVSLMENKYENS